MTRSPQKAFTALVLALCLLILGCTFALLAPAVQAAAPETAALTLEQAEAEFDDRLRQTQKRLSLYNKTHEIATHRDRHWNAKIMKWKVERVAGDRVYVSINFEIGRWGPKSGSALFHLQWTADGFQFVGHGPMPKRDDVPGVLATSQERGCIYNYFATRPCTDTVRLWQEFTEVHGLEMDGDSAKILQAYKHHDFDTGDRLMARARGLPPPQGRSVFALQDEVAALDLGRYQRNPEQPCDFSPYGPRPCPEVLPIFEDFMARHGLESDRRSAAMFESFANGDFRRADTIYALAKGYPVPAYGYIPTGIAREVAERWMELDRMNKGPETPCDYNPYGTRPCVEMVALWHDFAERYQLADTKETANILQAYAEGDYKQADQLFAQAKGISLDLLLEAAGVPTDDLVIEVYPGRKQLLQLKQTGS